MQDELIPNLFRVEYSKLVAVLCNSFGLSNIQVAEDIVSDTFLLAAETWGKKGIPGNQVGWLYQVAKNRTLDYLKREKIRTEKVDPSLKSELSHEPGDVTIDLSTEGIRDSQLRMLFAVCHPALDTRSQIMLALRVLCGFGIDEIAGALLSNKEQVNKALYRAKKRLREAEINLLDLEDRAYPTRLDVVLRTLYLLFSEGYYSSSKQFNLKKDLCLEAMRLTLLLTQYPQSDLPRVNALLALMCFHASRFDARMDSESGPVLYEDQDRSKWEPALIERGEYFLNRAATGSTAGKYHLEAAIAFWHTQIESQKKWENVLQLYNQLLQIEYSPLAALNRTYALAKARNKAAGLQAALKLGLDSHALYHCLLAELHDDPEEARNHLEQALTLTHSEHEKTIITRKLESLNR